MLQQVKMVIIAMQMVKMSVIALVMGMVQLMEMTTLVILESKV